MLALALLKCTMLCVAFNGSSSLAQPIPAYQAADPQSLLQSIPVSPQFLQQQPQQFQQTDQQEIALPTQMTQMQGTASFPMQDVMSLMESMQGLQKKEKSLERQLAEARAQETQLNGNALSATYRSNVFEQRAQKLADLAQTSANQAQESMDQLSDMKRRLVASEREKQALAKQLYQAEEVEKTSERQVRTVSKRFKESEGAKQALTKQLSQTQTVVKNLRNVLASTQRKQHDAAHAQQVAELQAREAEAREMGALDAAGKEDKAIEQEEAMLDKLKVHEDGERQMRALDASGMIQKMDAEEESRTARFIGEVNAGKAREIPGAVDLSPQRAAGRGRIGARAPVPNRPRLRGGLSTAAFQNVANLQ